MKWQPNPVTAATYHVGTPADLSAKLAGPQYGLDVPADHIRAWARRGKILRANPEINERGATIRPCYRLIDVLEVARSVRKKIPEGQAA